MAKNALNASNIDSAPLNVRIEQSDMRHRSHGKTSKLPHLMAHKNPKSNTAALKNSLPAIYNRQEKSNQEDNGILFLESDHMPTF